MLSKCLCLQYKYPHPVRFIKPSLVKSPSTIALAPSAAISTPSTVPLTAMLPTTSSISVGALPVPMAKPSSVVPLVQFNLTLPLVSKNCTVLFTAKNFARGLFVPCCKTMAESAGAFPSLSTVKVKVPHSVDSSSAMNLPETLRFCSLVSQTRPEVVPSSAKKVMVTIFRDF